MPRKPRNFASGVAYHVTQCGNGGQDVFLTTAGRNAYLDLLRRSSSLNGIHVYAYCLMTNHVHLIVQPEEGAALSAFVQQVHGRYATYRNLATCRTGHVWEAHFRACGLESTHLWNAIRYTEWNPVRANLCPRPEDYQWSSARAHLKGLSPGDWLDYGIWQMAGQSVGWRELLEFPQDELERIRIRHCTRSGQIFGGVAPTGLTATTSA